MEKTLLLFLVFGMHVNAFAQTTLAPDQYEPNNTSNQARFLFDPSPFEPADSPPGYKRVIQANFHDATDDSDWYIMTFTNPNIYQQLPPYWGPQTQAAHLGCYPYIETVEVALSGMASDAVYSLSINNAPSGTGMSSNPTLPSSFSGSQNVRVTAQLATNNCGTIESLYIGVRRAEGNTANERYTLTFSFYRNQPGLSTITSISPASGPVGTIVTITGNNLGLGPIIFSSNIGDSNIYCYYRLPAPAQTLTSVTATVPTCAITGPVFATTSFGGGRGANSQIFTVTNQNPSKIDSSPQKSSDSSGGNTSKWVITPVATMKGVLGALDINFPADIERNILIHQQSDNKFLRSVSRNDKTYTIAPGNYNFVLSNVPVENVPIQKGHITRLKAGFLNIVSEGVWNLYDETKEKAYTSGNKPRKLALPVGKYQLKLGGDYYPFEIKDGGMVEY